MTQKSDDFALKFDRLTDAQAKAIDELNDEEIIAEITEEFGDPNELAVQIRKAMQDAIAERGKQRLAAARAVIDARNEKASARILDLPLSAKKEVYEKLRNNAELNLTLAARNEEDTEADLDSVLEDLRDLGVIDDEGNLL